MAPTNHTKIFISYRRSDTKPEAGRLAQTLRLAFGADRVFQDVDMQGGDRYPTTLNTKLEEASIVLALIGDTWVSATKDKYGQRRIDDPKDWVRHEIKTALASNKLLIPLLVDDGFLPTAKEAADVLPAEIANIVFQQAEELRNDHWDNDAEALLKLIGEKAGWEHRTSAPPSQSPGPRLFGRPPIVVDNFQDRDQLLTSIDEANDTVLCAVHGIGGVGKSQLAAKYFEVNQHRYGYAVWIDMREQGGRAGMTQLAQALGIAQPGVDLVDSAVNYIKDSDSTWLLVFDNADDPQQVQAIQPTGPHIRTVVTSRWRNWKGFGTPVEIPVFDQATALASGRATLDRITKSATHH